jgi:hypothetical protein
MEAGDLVRCWMLEVVEDHPYHTGPVSDPYAPTVQRDVPRVGVIVEYREEEKLALVAFQDTGETSKVRTQDIELIKRNKPKYS